MTKHIIDPSVGNATRFQTGISGNPKGRPLGRKSLSTIIRDIGEQSINWKNIPIKSKGISDLNTKFNNYTPFEAIVFTAFGEALNGSIQAMEWLRRAGYGDKLNVEGTKEIGIYNADKIIIEPVKN